MNANPSHNQVTSSFSIYENELQRDHRLAVAVFDESAQSGRQLFYLPPSLIEESCNALRRRLFAGTEKQWAIRIAERFVSSRSAQIISVELIRVHKLRDKRANQMKVHGVLARVAQFRVGELPITPQPSVRLFDQLDADAFLFKMITA